MKLEAEHIEAIAGYMADSLEDHLDIVFWDGIARVLDEFNIDYEDIGDISDEDCEAIVNYTRLMFAPKADLGL
mgnify:FL=1|tara:strand:- start:844 stop:1062 length:219 start_codon:yes stop_codon:yes gene_type:complete